MSDWIPRPYRMKIDSYHEGGPKKGDVVYRWTAPTYGVLGAREVAVTFQPDEAPFFSVDREDLEGARYLGFAIQQHLVANVDDEFNKPASIILVDWVPYD